MHARLPLCIIWFVINGVECVQCIIWVAERQPLTMTINNKYQANHHTPSCHQIHTKNGILLLISQSMNYLKRDTQLVCSSSSNNSNAICELEQVKCTGKWVKAFLRISNAWLFFVRSCERDFKHGIKCMWEEKRHSRNQSDLSLFQHVACSLCVFSLLFLSRVQENTFTLSACACPLLVPYSICLCVFPFAQNKKTHRKNFNCKNSIVGVDNKRKKKEEKAKCFAYCCCCCSKKSIFDSQSTYQIVSIFFAHFAVLSAVDVAYARKLIASNENYVHFQ